MTLLFDVAPVGGGIAVFAGVAFFFIFAVIAFIAFKMLKKTVKMAVRVAVVAIIITIAVAGSVFFFVVGTSKPVRPPRPVPTANR